MTYEDLIKIENLFQAWDEFVRGKRRKKDVGEFAYKLEDNLFDLHQRLKNKIYRHGGYQDFYVADPKRRHIHKARVEDRVVHHLLYKYLYSIFDKIFIYDSYSCRLDRGTHKGVKRLESFTRKVSRNYTRPCWALKLDIKKFFASVDHNILKNLIEKKIKDKNILWLIGEVIDSFQIGVEPLKGIPLGNLTSQIFANIYLNELDQFIKNNLKIKCYLRYADDFIILDSNKDTYYRYTSILAVFLKDNLKLELHPKKIILRNLKWGIDFLGYIVLPHYMLPRTKTKKRAFRKIYEKSKDLENGVISEYSFNQAMQSYLGYFKHSSSYKLSFRLRKFLAICY
ncbi:MAG: reverse transcriptase/maturase family protein [Patescibacteria group bacterium]